MEASFVPGSMHGKVSDKTCVQIVDALLHTCCALRDPSQQYHTCPPLQASSPAASLPQYKVWDD